MTQQTLFDVGQMLDMSNIPSEKRQPSVDAKDILINDVPANIENLYNLSTHDTRQGDAPLSNMSNMSNTCLPQQLTVNRDSRGTMPSYAWLAWCQQCELKQPFTDYDEREAWVNDHRKTTHHRVQSGAGKI